MHALHRSFCALVGVLVSGASAAQSGPAPDQLSVSVAARMFVNRISGVGYASTGVPGLNPTYANISTSTEVSFLPSLALRYGRFVMTGSFQPTTQYETPLTESPGVTGRPERREWDISMGYAVMPSLVVSAGWKEASVKTSLAASVPVPQSVLPLKIAGPFIGAAASTPMGTDWSLYGNLAYGRPDTKINGSTIGSSTEYISTEFGLQYSLRGLGQSFERAVLILGYRMQSFRTKNAAVSVLGMNPANGAVGFQNGSLSSRSTIDGVTIGVAFAF